MAALYRILTDNLGLAGRGLTSADLCLGKISTGTTYVWILSSALPQTKQQKGIWEDDATWDDDALWYD